MEEKELLKISLVCSLIGLLIMLFILQKYEVPSYDIKDIDKSLLNEKVKIKGGIDSLTETPGLYILNVKDSTGKITVVVFKENELDFLECELIEVEGTVSEYKNQVEIIAKQIKC